MNKNIMKFAVLNGGVTALYIIAVASFMFYMPKPFDNTPSVLIGVAMLSLFVFSAAFTGMMVLGRPVQWYLDGKKKDAVSLLATTVGFLFLLTLLAFAALFIQHGR